MTATERQARYRATDKGKATRKRIQQSWNARNRASINDNKRRRYSEQKALCDKVKLASGCVDCGYKTNSAALDFDHVRGTKRFNISWKYGQVSDRLLLAEIEKCEVRCANCHRIRTTETQT